MESRLSSMSVPITKIFGILTAIFGIILLVGGINLAQLGGSWYYVVAGLLLITSGIQYFRMRASGPWLFLIILIGTVLWAIAEVGFEFWPLVGRLSAFIVLAIPAYYLAGCMPVFVNSRTRWIGAGSVMLFVAIIGGVSMFYPHPFQFNPLAWSGKVEKKNVVDSGNWPAYGGTLAGTRFVQSDQITKENVKKLKVAWTYRTGEIPGAGSEYQNTPLKIGDNLYICTPLNQVIALNADTGIEKWRYDPKVSNNGKWTRCRGVSYFESENNSARIITSTTDGRLIALDAKTGALISSFGESGIVDLRGGLGLIKNAYYVPTSAPMIAKGLILVGGWVYDNQEVGEPSGVVRAFDAETGKIVWAWDIGQPNMSNPPSADQLYTRGTPNVWSAPAYDPSLGLVYLPTGNATPDYWGGHRRSFDEKYSSSIVALDIATGKPRWSFQTTHHDLWDYDVPAQPALYDMPDGHGSIIPTLVQVTKRGQIFVLDRRNGKPVKKIEEKPVPQGAAPGDHLSPTQPYSVNMPLIGLPKLSESDMWGATPIDQLMCRIAFKKLRYEGDFTPPRPNSPSLQHPGNYGGMNWGSSALDEERGLLYVNDIRLPLTVMLEKQIPGKVSGAHDGKNLYSGMSGTPYAVLTSPFMSPLGIPCVRPPFGTLSAVDLRTGKLVWQRPAGTVKDVHLGVKVGLPIPLGMPTLGGPMATRTGIMFYAGTQDYYLRAFNGENGEELWKGRLPVGTQGTPISYTSSKTGRQYVVIVAGGARQSPDRGDYVIAYALPEKN